MSIEYFTLLVLYVSVMTLIFATGVIMIHPRTRIIFKAPVPHLHKTIGTLMIPWGISYLIFLPDFVLSFNGVPWRNYEYIVVTMITTIMCISIISWSYMSCLQQGVRQRTLQPIILFLPITITIGYLISLEEWLLQAFLYVCVVEIAFLVGYYVKIYKAFVADVKENYSNFNASMLRGLWLQWVATAFVIIVFVMCTIYDTILWNIINTAANVFTICVLIYTSEHFVPLPEKTKVANDVELSEQEVKSHQDLTKALSEKCAETLLYCNANLSLQDLAMAVGTNRTYLSKWFVTNNTSFYNYINNLRAEYAQKLVVSSNKTISEIQYAAGFTSKTTFNKYFAERYGSSPAEYRKSKKK